MTPSMCRDKRCKHVFYQLVRSVQINFKKKPFDWPTTNSFGTLGVPPTYVSLPQNKCMLCHASLESPLIWPTLKAYIHGT